MKFILAYATALYLAVFCFGLYLTSAHGGSVTHSRNPAPPQPVTPIPSTPTPEPKSITTPPEYVVPRHARTDAPARYQEVKPCKEFLTICQKSCADRGDMYRFTCTGETFASFSQRYRCQCGDELFASDSPDTRRRPQSQEPGRDAAVGIAAQSLTVVPRD